MQNDMHMWLMSQENELPGIKKKVLFKGQLCKKLAYSQDVQLYGLKKNRKIWKTSAEFVLVFIDSPEAWKELTLYYRVAFVVLF